MCVFNIFSHTYIYIYMVSHLEHGNVLGRELEQQALHGAEEHSPALGCLLGRDGEHGRELGDGRAELELALVDVGDVCGPVVEA